MLTLHRPSVRLSGLVSRISAYEENGTGMHDSVEAASLVVPLIFCFRGGFSIAFDRRPGAHDSWSSFTAGLHTGHVRMDSAGTAECLQIDFTPIGARLFFGIAMDALAGRMVSLDDLGDRQVRTLGERLAEMTDRQERIALAERFVIARIAQARAGISPELLHAFGRIHRAHGDVRVTDIARDLGWSRRRLVERFRDEIGLAPKSVARIVRFTHATEIATRSATADWADIAFACGYSDQAHLSREFVEFSGAPPRRWLRDIGVRASGTNLQDFAPPPN